MAEIASHKHGEFCWYELATSDGEGAKSFYGKLFGWEGEDQPLGPSRVYTLVKKEGLAIGGVFEIDAEETARGITPHCNCYIFVEDIDDAIAQVVALGGRLREGPFERGDTSRFALVAEPGGAFFSMWQPKLRHGARRANEEGVFCWGELRTTDPDSAAKFFGMLCGWTLEKHSLFVLDGQPVAGLGPAISTESATPPHWMMYIEVENLEATIQRAEALGANVVEPANNCNFGKKALLRDPQGVVIGLMQRRAAD